MAEEVRKCMLPCMTVVVDDCVMGATRGILAHLKFLEHRVDHLAGLWQDFWQGFRGSIGTIEPF